MRQQIRLTENELKAIVRESVVRALNEFGDKESTRKAMADASNRALEKGDDSVYHNAMNSLNKRNSSKKELSQFQDRFEKGKSVEEEGEFNEQPTNDLVGEGRFQVKVNEAQLRKIVKESVNRILMKTLQ